MDYSKCCVALAVLAFSALCFLIYWNLPSVRKERKWRTTFFRLSAHCGKVLQYLREERGLGRKALAKVLEESAPHLYIDEATIIVIEKGDLIPEFRVVVAILNALNLSVDDLLWQMIRERYGAKSLSEGSQHGRESIYG
jgi:DNA-binding XRE family transcriptional regulator